MDILVARQPVFDQREQLYGYDLVLHGRSNGSDAEPAPEQLVADAFLGIGIDQVAAGRRAFVTVDRDMLLGGAVRLLPADRIVLQLNDSHLVDAELIQACDQLVWSGYRFSVSSAQPETLPEELLRLAEIVKVDVAAINPAMLPELATWLRAFQVRLLAVHVRHRLERDHCTRLGFELFEGYRFTAPETLSRRDLPIEHVLTFRLMKMVRDPRTTDHEIEELLRRDVALSYKLLRMVNSAAMGGRDIWSIGHALRLLGRDQVARWLGLLLVTDGAKDGVRAELMHLALVRARMCELLADASGVPRARGPLFLVGMLSVLDQLLETPMETLADSMELAPDVRVALLHREDFYGAVLGVVEAYEQGWWDQVDVLAQTVGVGAVTLAPLYLESLAWASEHQLSVDDRTPRRDSGPQAAARIAGR
jgi:EAL and modified HD-GYP domain-containing signal transduction protein